MWKWLQMITPEERKPKGAFYFDIENKRDILNPTLLARITAYGQSLTTGGLKLHSITMSRQQPE